MSRAAWWFLGAVGALLGLARLTPQGPRDYVFRIPPDIRPYTPPSFDSLIAIEAACFNRTEADARAVRWFLTDSSLGLTDDRQRAAGRYFPQQRAIVIQRPYQWSVELAAHELRHHLTNRMDHPPSVFLRHCPE